jgi:hypothetical protein
MASALSAVNDNPATANPPTGKIRSQDRSFIRGCMGELSSNGGIRRGHAVAGL